MEQIRGSDGTEEVEMKSHLKLALSTAQRNKKDIVRDVIIPSSNISAKYLKSKDFEETI